MDRDKLLGSFDWKPRVREAIATLPSQFALLPLFSGAMVQFEFIGAQFREALRASAVEPITMLEADTADLRGKDQALSLVRVQRLGSDDLNIQQAPVDLDVITRCRQMPPIPGIPVGWDTPCLAWPEHLCSSSRPLVASNVIAFPHRQGIGFVFSCDRSVSELGKQIARTFGANQVFHPSTHEYLKDGLAARGIDVTDVAQSDKLGGLERTDQPLPALGMDPSPRGWRLVRDDATLSRTRLAAAIMEVWAQEGGGTQRFLSEVNRFIQSSGSPEPLLTGLFNLGAQSLTMLSSLLGVDTEDLIGELIDDMTDASGS